MGGRIYHLSGSKKFIENSMRGIRKAIRLRFWSIDIDMFITADGVIVGKHWRLLKTDKFYDPESKISPNASITQLTWEEASRLRTKDGYRIWRIEALIAACGNKIVPTLEPKDPRFTEQKWWDHIAAVSKKAGVKTRMYALRNLNFKGFGARCVAAAKAAKPYSIPGRVIH